MASAPEPTLSALKPSLDMKERLSTEEQYLEHGDAHMDAERARLDKQVLRKLDLLIMPLVCIIYLLGYLDRANVGNARVVRLLLLPSL